MMFCNVTASGKNKHALSFLALLLFFFFLSPPSLRGEESTDYTNPANWSILCNDTVHDTDVFFVHPTTYGGPAKGNYNADLRDKELNEKTDTGTIIPLIRVFEESCNVFAPRYRQMNIEVLGFSEEKRRQYLELPLKDIQQAFTYYLKNFNEGRPFILASHSQGSNILQILLLSRPELFPKEQLVAAYMPGWTFTEEDLRKMGLPLGNTPEEIGVVLTWNTVGAGGSSPTLSKGALCVNPLSWTADSREYPTSTNKGARIILSPENFLEIPHFTSARINSLGGLEIPTPEPEVLGHLNISMGNGCYHRYDYDFFFYNIRDNVAIRCETYRMVHKKDKETEKTP